MNTHEPDLATSIGRRARPHPRPGGCGRPRGRVTRPGGCGRRHDHQSRRRLAPVAAVALALALLATLLLASCSVVFTAGINGRVVDAEVFAENPQGGGINGVRVYLYLRERDRSADRERYETEGLLPDEEGGDGYYLETVTQIVGGEAGVFAFPTIYWNDLLPTYGRTGDRRDVYFLLYEPDYGLEDHSATIVNDTTNTLAPVEITSLYDEATISGRVERGGSATGVAGATVSIFVADQWDSTSFSYPTEPTEDAVTGPDGNFTATLSVLRDVIGEAGGGSALLTFEADDYIATTTTDADLADDRDVDGDGTNDVHYQTPLLTPDETTELPTISLKQVSFTESLDGRVGVDTDADGNIDVGTNGAVISIYVNRSSPPGAADPADYTTTSGNLLVDQDVEAGWFSFDDLTWEDTDYTGNQSSITCYLDVDVGGDGTIGAGDVDNRQLTVYSNTSNTVQIVQP